MSTPTLLAPRYGAHLDADGTWAASPRLDGDTVTLELWERDGDQFTPRQTDLRVEPSDQLLPIERHRLMVCTSAGRVHAVWLLDCATLVRTRLATLSGQAARLLAPARGDPDRRPWALQHDGENTSLTRLPDLAEPTEPEVGCQAVGSQPDIDLPGTYSGGVWTDPAGHRLGLGHSTDGQPTTAIELDLVNGGIRTLFEVTARSNDSVQVRGDRTGLTVVHTDAGGVERLGYALVGVQAVQPWVFPDELAAPAGLIEAVAVDPAGQRILAHERRGVRSLLRRYDVQTNECIALDVAPGALCGLPVWTETGLIVPWSTPSVPLTFLDLGPDGNRRGSSAPAWLGQSGQAGDSGARVVMVPGAAGPIEAIAFGGEDWIRRPQLVVALHGGPLGAWTLSYEPLLDRLARGDIAVLAINPRGSVGYGYAFAAAIRDGWGGADLEDVLAVGRHLRAARGGSDGLGLLGGSYGAFLALLAACVEPELWRYCAALSPFSSAPRLLTCAGPAVHRLVGQLGGLREPAQGQGPRDLIRLAHRAKARLLLVHGRYDETVPVAHARELAQAFARECGPPVRYEEMKGAGHDLGRPAVWDLVCQFVWQRDADDVTRRELSQ